MDALRRGLGDRLWARSVVCYGNWPEIYGSRSSLTPRNTNDSLVFLIWSFSVETAAFGVLFYIESNTPSHAVFPNWSLSGWWSGVATITWEKDKATLCPVISIRSTINGQYNDDRYKIRQVTNFKKDFSWSCFTTCCNCKFLHANKDLTETLSRYGFVVDNYNVQFRGDLHPLFGKKKKKSWTRKCAVCNRVCSALPSRCQCFLSPTLNAYKKRRLPTNSDHQDDELQPPRKKQKH